MRNVPTLHANISGYIYTHIHRYMHLNDMPTYECVWCVYIRLSARALINIASMSPAHKSIGQWSWCSTTNAFLVSYHTSTYTHTQDHPNTRRSSVEQTHTHTFTIPRAFMSAASYRVASIFMCCYSNSTSNSSGNVAPLARICPMRK